MKTQHLQRVRDGATLVLRALTCACAAAISVSSAAWPQSTAAAPAAPAPRSIAPASAPSTETAPATEWETNDDQPLPSGPAASPHAPVKEVAAIGRKLFFDRGLSASGRVACASCHDPRFAYGPPNALPVQQGGKDLRQEGTRAAPSLKYIERVPVFTEHYFDEDVDESIDNGPTGGLTWDGRVQNPHEQARIPLLSPLEMANPSDADVVMHVARSRYAGMLRKAYGTDIFSRPTDAFDAITRSLEVFLNDPAEFFPYTSKYDAVLRNQAELSARERRGLKLFNNPDKGNCAHCHPSTIGQNHSFPAFTDYGYAALAVPRNAALSANKDPDYFDLGLCGPYRTDLAGRTGYCGMFRTPTLRNIALRRTFFHNGQFHELRDVMLFYVQRDIHPERWYGKGVHSSRAYDDLPQAYHAQIDKEPPFDRGPGSTPALTDTEINDIIVFLNTLTDGWKGPKSP